MEMKVLVGLDERTYQLLDKLVNTFGAKDVVVDPSAPRGVKEKTKIKEGKKSAKQTTDFRQYTDMQKAAEELEKADNVLYKKVLSEFVDNNTESHGAIKEDKWGKALVAFKKALSEIPAEPEPQEEEQETTIDVKAIRAETTEVIKKIVKARKAPKAKELNKTYGVVRATDVSDEKVAEYLEDLKEILNAKS